MAAIADIHASCVRLEAAGAPFDAPADAGILLLGDSGAGKSEAALQLIGRGARLVSDDRTQLFVRDGALWARPHPRLAGLMEVREVGILAMPFAPEARIVLAVRLIPGARLPETARYAPPEALHLLQSAAPLRLDIALQPALAEKIALAAAAETHALWRDTANPPSPHA